MDPSDFEEPKKVKPAESELPTMPEQHEDSKRVSDAMHHVDHTRVKMLAIAFLFVISGSMGFLGG